MANINKIRVSGTTYNIQDSNAPKTVELTQAQYDALVTGGTVDPNTFYIITDAAAGDLSNYYTKSETSGATEISTALASKQDTLVSGTNVKTINNESILGSGNITIEGGGSSYTAGDGIDITNDVISVTGKVDTSAFTAHTADTVIHVTASEKSTWNNKSDFSGDYNDLSNKPTIPTSASQLTNDSGYITSSALDGYATEAYVTAATNDMATKTWVGQQGYLTQHQDISGKQDVSGMTAYTTTATTNTLSGTVTAHTADTTIHVTAQDKTNWNNKSDFSGSYNDLTNKLSAGTNITIVDNVISATGGGGGGGKAIEAGRGISITTGETADTVSFNLPIYSGTGEGSIIGGFSGNTASGKYSFALGGRYESMFDYQYCRATGKGAISFGGTASGQGAFSCGENPQALGFFSVAFGDATKAIGVESFVIGRNTTANTFVSFAQGKYTKTTNEAEVALGEYNNSVSGSTTFGDSGNTLFSVGNGTANNARHNAFEIRQNGDIYCSDGTNDVKLQDTITATAANTTALGGLKLVKLSQSEYDGLATKDNSTLYVIVN